MSKECMLYAPMMGKVIQIDVNPGDKVEEEDDAILIEAMKMENALPAPASGTLAAMNYASGDSVAKDDVLAVIE